MPPHLPRKSLTRQFDQDHLKPSGTGALHYGETVGIPGDQNNAVHRSIRGIGCNVEAQPHIDSLLLEARPKVVVRQPFRRYGHFLRHKSPKLQRTETNGKLRFGRQLPEPFVGARELLSLAGNGQSQTALIGCAIVVEDPKQDFLWIDADMCDSLDEGRVVSEFVLPGQDPKMAAVNEDCCFCGR